jgi:hypothetical protein
MNPLNDDLAKLFAADEPGTHDAEFLGAVRRRIATHRSARTLLALGLGAAAAVSVLGVAMLMPDAALYPVQWLYDMFTSPLVALTAVTGAIGVVWWTTFVEA